MYPCPASAEDDKPHNVISPKPHCRPGNPEIKQLGRSKPCGWIVCKCGAVVNPANMTFYREDH